MSNEDVLLISMTPTGRYKIDDIGDYELEEIEFTMEVVSSNENATFVEVSREYLLPGTAEDYITIKQAALETGISIKKLRDLAAKGKLNAIKLGNTWLLLRESVLRYFDENSTL